MEMMTMTDRERLVELLLSVPCGYDGAGADGIADYLLANGVIVPPCKVGDSCYPLNASETELTCEEKISRITISERNIIIGYYEHWDYSNRCRKTDTWRLPLRTRILGKGVFLTREEAERALKEREQV
jgi:hypothetical protein